MKKISSAVEALTKLEIEGKILEFLESFGWKILRGCDISPYSRGKYHDDGDEGVVLEDILCDILDKLNSGLPLYIVAIVSRIYQIVPASFCERQETRYVQTGIFGGTSKIYANSEGWFKSSLNQVVSSRLNRFECISCLCTEKD